MDYMLWIVCSAANLLCFLAGARIGQKVVNGERVELTEVHPIERIRSRAAKRAAEEEANRANTILQNIERYDGTGRGQEDVPGR